MSNNTEEKADKDQRFSPNYEEVCGTCGQYPTVDNSGMCGPCYFGEADCIDPQNW